MSDSPAVYAPPDEKESPILDKLLILRTTLELLNRDKSTYVKSQDILKFEQEVYGQVEALNTIRDEGQKRLEQNRVDTVLDDCFQLISLSYMTIGKNNEAPAVYSAVSTMKRLLDHLKEAAFFSPKDLESIDLRIHQYRDCVERGKGTYSPHLVTLLEARLDVCESLLHELQQSLSQLSRECKPYYEKLVSILRSLSACNTRSKYPKEEVENLHQQLKETAAELREEDLTPSDQSATDRLVEKIKTIKIGGDSAPPGEHQLITDLFIRCFLWVEIIEEKQGRIDEPFREVYEKLSNIRNQLEKLTLTHSWSLRETDLYSYQRRLDRVDEARVDGNFIGTDGKPSGIHTQRTLLYLLRKSYALIYHLIISSEPVSEALLPIYNQLMTLKRCLIEVKRAGGVSSPRELYPYSMKMNSIDNMRVDGKFMIGDDIPDGQGATTELLSECFDLAYELRTAAEEREEEEDAKAATATTKVDGEDK